MRRTRSIALFCLAGVFLAGGSAVLALSVELPAPDLYFAKGVDARAADAVRNVLRDKRFHYLHGLYSHWPPKWQTTLAYEGNTQALRSMLEDLGHVPGIHVHLSFSEDLARETANKRPDGDWWVIYEQDMPDTVTVRVDKASKSIDSFELTAAIAPAEPTDKPGPSDHLTGTAPASDQSLKHMRYRARQPSVAARLARIEQLNAELQREIQALRQDLGLPPQTQPADLEDVQVHFR